MVKRATASRRTQATSSRRERATASGTTLASGRTLPSSLDLRRAAASWISDCRARGLRPTTVADREATLNRFLWWVENQEETPVDRYALTADRLRAFLAYIQEPTKTGRFGCDRASAKRAPRPATINAYYRVLRAFANFCVEEGLVGETPFRKVKEPKVPDDQVQPLTHEQVQALVDAARRTRNPERDVAVILLLVDTGMRISELVGLTVGDVDRGAGQLWVTGKGNKRRSVFMGVAARRALWRYLEADRHEAAAEEPLFAAVGGHCPGAGLTRSGAAQIVQKAGKAAVITGVRCSPHTLRHTFAVNFLRNGGNLIELQMIMGHEDLAVLKRYLALAQADLAQAHRQASPADHMRLR